MTLRYLLNVTLSLSVLLALAGCGENGGGQNGKNPAAAEGEHGQEQESGHGEAKREVHLSEEQAALLTIEVGKALGGTADALVSAPATVTFDPDRTARVGPRLSAKVVELQVDLGDQVRAGQPLALMDSVELGRAKAGYLAAQGRLESARADWEREQLLAKQQISSEAELLDAKAAFQAARGEFRSALETLKLYGVTQDKIDEIGSEPDDGPPLSRFILASPVAGVVQRRDLVPGQTVSADQTPIHVVNSEKMWVMAEVAETDMPRLAVGQRMTLTVRALPGKTFTGNTDWVSRKLETQSRTVRVRAVVPNEAGLLRAGMFGTAGIHTESEQRFALVPVNAVQTVEGQQVVFVPGDEPGSFRAVPVRTGKEKNGQIEILSGVNIDEPVVVSGAFDLMSALTASGREAAH